MFGTLFRYNLLFHAEIQSASLLLKPTAQSSPAQLEPAASNVLACALLAQSISAYRLARAHGYLMFHIRDRICNTELHEDESSKILEVCQRMIMIALVHQIRMNTST